MKFETIVGSGLDADGVMKFETIVWSGLDADGLMKFEGVVVRHSTSMALGFVAEGSAPVPDNRQRGTETF